MFFATPEVKSLSKYSEFGSYLQPKHFLIMTMIAISIHIAVVVICSLEPKEEVMQIPVRVLNIKLDGGSAGELDIPPASAMPGYVPPPPQITLEKNISNKKPVIEMPPEKNKHFAKKDSQKVVEFTPEELNFNKPRKYVRTEEMNEQTDKNKTTGNGSGMSGTAAGDEIVRRYEQEIPLWVDKHKIYPDAARQRGIEGIAVVRIRIDRNGNILYSAIDHSSGSQIIDQAALEMVHNSNPLPPVPKDYEGNELEFLLPETFTLQ